jgi:hypothetical protein
MPGFMVKTSELINRFSSAAQRYETTLKTLEARRQRMVATTPDRLRAGNEGAQSE